MSVSTGLGTSGRDVNWLSVLLAGLAALLCVRLFALSVNGTDLFFDEAQYWAWSQEPAFGYFSKPPLIAWIIGAATDGVRARAKRASGCPRRSLHTATALVVFWLGRRLYDAAHRRACGSGVCDAAGRLAVGRAHLHRRAAAVVLGAGAASALPRCSKPKTCGRRCCSALPSAPASMPSTPWRGLSLCAAVYLVADARAPRVAAATTGCMLRWRIGLAAHRAQRRLELQP